MVATGEALIATIRRTPVARIAAMMAAVPGRGDPGVGVVVRAERGQHRVGPGDRGFQDLRVGGGEVGGDDPRGPPGEQLGGELGGVAGHRGDVVPGVQGLGQQLAADAAGGGDDG